MFEIDLLDFTETEQTPNHGERAHSPLGASACSRWWNCPGSIYLSKGIISRTSIFAREGTVAHELSQKCLEENTDAHQYVGLIIDNIPVTEEMAERVQVYVDECRLQAETATVPPMVETRISLARLNPPADMFGTADFMVVQGGILTVVDLKFGKGVKVTAAGNPQLKYYALGALYALPDDIGIRKVKVGIVQPRAIGYEKPDYVEYDILELLEWSVELIERAEIAMQPTATVNPGSWCRFCPASGFCPEQANKALRAAQDSFSVDEHSVVEVVMPQISALTPQQMSVLLDNAKIIEDWVAALRSAGEALLNVNPNAIPNYEMAPKRGQRCWVTEKSAALLLAEAELTDEEIYVSEIISPSKAEDLIARKLKAEDKTIKSLAAAKKIAKEFIKHDVHSISSGLTLKKKTTETSLPEDVFA